jgi:hypothetical protein
MFVKHTVVNVAWGVTGCLWSLNPEWLSVAASASWLHVLTRFAHCNHFMRKTFYSVAIRYLHVQSWLRVQRLVIPPSQGYILCARHLQVIVYKMRHLLICPAGSQNTDWLYISVSAWSKMLLLISDIRPFIMQFESHIWPTFLLVLT